MQRVFVLILVAATTAGLWQLVPEVSVQAGPPVDQQIARISGAPASFADVIEAVQPAVVNISVSGPARPQANGGRPPTPPGMNNFEDFLRRFFERQNYPDSRGAPPGKGGQGFQGMGSGFIIAPEGYVVTNHHVIQAASEIAVTLGDGTRLEAEIVGLGESYRLTGLNGLRATILQRLGRRPAGSSIYLLTDGRYAKIVGNLDRWPAVEPDEDGWLNLELNLSVSSSGQEASTHPARAKPFLLPGGFHLLVGRDMYELRVFRTRLVRTLGWGLALTVALALAGAFVVSRSRLRRIGAINE